MPRATSRLFAIAALLAALAALPARAITLLTEENPPFNYTDKGRLTGMSTEIVAEAARRAGLPVRSEVLPWETGYVRAQAERDTCIYSTARLESRERLFLWVGPIAVNRWAVYGKQDFQVAIRSLKDLTPYKIGAVTRDAKAEYLRDNGVTNVRTLDDDTKNPARLFLDRDNPDHIDLWITNFYSARDVARAAKAGEVKVVFVAGEQPLFLACSPQTPRDTVKALSDAVESMRADGSLARITQDYERRFGK